MVRKSLIVLLSIWSLFLRNSFGQEVPKPPRLELEEIVVTPTRIEEPLAEVPLTTSIITREKIEATHAQDVGEVLRIVSGVEIKRYGSLGASSSASLRGSTSSQVLVLVDDRSVNSISLGLADLSQLPLSNVERIEIVKGPTSHLYGANALGGVINIITKRPPERPSFMSEGSYGAFHTRSVILDNGTTLGKFSYRISGGLKESDGFRDNSDYDSKDLSTKLRYKFGDKLSTTLSLGLYAGDLGVPGPQPKEGTSPKYGNTDVTSLFDCQKDFNYFAHLSLNWELEDRSKIILKSYGDRRWQRFNTRYDDWSTGNLILEENKYRSVIFGGGGQYELKLDPHHLVLGFDSHRDEFKAKVTSTDTVAQTENITEWNPQISSQGLWTQGKLQIWEPLSTTLGVRYDHHSKFGSEISPNLGLVYELGEKTTIKVSLGKAYRAPTMNDLFWPRDPYSEGNPNVKPEKGWAYEVGLERCFGEMVFSRISLFKRDIKDMIAWLPTGTIGPWGSPRWRPENVNEQSLQGIELGFTLTLGKNFSASFAYTYLDAEQRNDELINSLTNETKEVTRRAAAVPLNQVVGDLSYQTKFKTKLSLQGQYLDERLNYYQDYSNWPNIFMRTKKLGSYFLLNSKLTQALGNNLELYAGVNNLLDIDYKEQFGSTFDDRDYPMPGRNFVSGLKVKF